MQLDLILALIAGVAVFVLSLLKTDLRVAVLRRLNNSELQVGSKLVVAFLVGFILYVLLTGRMPGIGQKIGLTIVSVLLIWANLYLHPGSNRGEAEHREN